MQELADPSLALNRARETYRKQGAVTEVWPSAGQETRNKLTDYWVANEVKPGQEFAILTNLIDQVWTGIL